MILNAQIERMIPKSCCEITEFKRPVWGSTLRISIELFLATKISCFEPVKFPTRECVIAEVVCSVTLYKCISTTEKKLKKIRLTIKLNKYDLLY